MLLFTMAIQVDTQHTQASHLYLGLRALECLVIPSPVASRSHASAVRNAPRHAHIYTFAVIGKMGIDTNFTCVDFCSSRVMARGLRLSQKAPVTLVLLHPGVGAVFILLHPQLELFTLCTRGVPLCCHLSQLGLCSGAP